MTVLSGDTHQRGRMTRVLGCIALIAAATKVSSMQAQAPQQPSSYELIEQARAAGRIDHETAYQYHVFAVFGDRRLPAEYHGDDSAIEEPVVLSRIGLLLPTLSPPTQAVLAPFFTEPSDSGSWMYLPTIELGEASHVPPDEPGQGHGPRADDADVGALRGSGSPPRLIIWRVVPAVGGKVKVWAASNLFPDDVGTAETLAQELTSTIWPHLTSLYWEPLSDGAFPNNSGGPELDVYLIRPGLLGRAGKWGGFTFPVSPGACESTAARILLDSREPVGTPTSWGLIHLMAHELVHAIHMATPVRDACADYDWFDEAVATWAEHYAYPDANREHGYAARFLANPEVTLDEPIPDVVLRGWRSYLFPFYLQVMGRERALPAIWLAFAGHDLRGGMDVGLKRSGKDLETTFAEFAVRNLNRESVDDYRRADSLKHHAAFEVEELAMAPGAAGVHEVAVQMGIPNLAAKYAHVGFAQDVSLVILDNPLNAVPYASVWLLEKINGQWKPPEEFTGSGKTWCRNEPGQNIEELYIVFANREWKDRNRVVDPGTHLPRISAYSSGCDGWIGTTVLTTIINADGNRIEETVHSSIRLGIDPALREPGDPARYWKSTEGAVHWSVQVTGRCSGAALGTFAIPDLPDDHVMSLSVWPEGGRMVYSAGPGPWPVALPTYTVFCPGHPPSEMVFLSQLTWYETRTTPAPLAADGKSFRTYISDTRAGPELVRRFVSSFRCARGC